jgi:hypothetical protein
VQVRAVAYIQMLKTFAQMIGMSQLDEVDPRQYQNTPSLRFKMSVGRWSGQLMQVVFDGDNHTETYNSYGVRRSIEMPQASVPVSELQLRLQQIQ